MVKVFNTAKIVLNIHVDDDLLYKANMRLFEATGSGAFLLTDNAEDLQSFFVIGKEIVAFDDEFELSRLAHYYLCETTERDEIADAGLRKSHSMHTYEIRLENMINWLK